MNQNYSSLQSLVFTRLLHAPSRISLSLVLAVLMFTTGCSTMKTTDASTANVTTSGSVLPGVPEIDREFRAMWIATVANIDWPSKRTLTTEQQQAEMVAMLDQAAALNMNAIVFQIRPHTDALYASEIEPWSEYLTGASGKAPDPYYDPLAFTIELAHERGIEVHVWFNPYRAWHPSARSEPSEDHIVNTRPDLAKEYGNHFWLDPGEEEVKQRSLDVFLDVVERYNIDGIHMDDYFYPYPIKDGDTDNDLDFPDEPSWQKYLAGGGTLARDDWRRDNVNDFVERLYDGTKALKPHVKVGISPFGIYRPGFPENIQGFDQYDRLYADALKWLQEGWVDYFTPQLYWQIARPAQSYVSLLSWWNESNTLERHLWPGIYTSRLIQDPVSGGYTDEEIINQIKWTQHLIDTDPGHVHFSAKALMPEYKLDNLTEQLRTGVYRDDVLPPAVPWLAEGQPLAVKGAIAVDVRDKDAADGQVDVKLTLPPGSDPGMVWCHVVQYQVGENWSHQIIYAPGKSWTATQIALEDGASIDRLVAYTVDRFGRTSEPTDLNF